MSNKEKFNTENFKAQFKKPVEYTGTGSSGGSCQYVAKLLLHPVKDGRHRLLWLVLAPYAITVLKLNRDNAIWLVRTYLEWCGELAPCEDVLSLVEQYVDYAATQDLHPPRLDTLQQGDPELFETVQEAIKE